MACIPITLVLFQLAYHSDFILNDMRKISFPWQRDPILPSFVGLLHWSGGLRVGGGAGPLSGHRETFILLSGACRWGSELYLKRGVGEAKRVNETGRKENFWAEERRYLMEEIKIKNFLVCGKSINFADLFPVKSLVKWLWLVNAFWRWVTLEGEMNDLVWPQSGRRLRSGWGLASLHRKSPVAAGEAEEE